MTRRKLERLLRDAIALALAGGVAQPVAVYAAKPRRERVSARTKERHADNRTLAAEFREHGISDMRPYWKVAQEFIHRELNAPCRPVMPGEFGKFDADLNSVYARAVRHAVQTCTN